MFSSLIGPHAVILLAHKAKESNFFIRNSNRKYHLETHYDASNQLKSKESRQNFEFTIDKKFVYHTSILKYKCLPIDTSQPKPDLAYFWSFEELQ